MYSTQVLYIVEVLILASKYRSNKKVDNHDTLIASSTNRLAPSSSESGAFSLQWTLLGEERQGKSSVLVYCSDKNNLQ